MSTTELVKELSRCSTSELEIVREAVDSLLLASKVNPAEATEIDVALAEADREFSDGRALPASEFWKRVGI